MAVRQIDHVVVAVDDLDRMAADLTGLGFLVTDRSDHPFGTSNRLIVLEECYIELVAVTKPDRVPGEGFPRFVADGLAAGRTGPLLVALRTDTPARDVERLRAAGLSFSEPNRFGRWLDLPDGDRRFAEFVTAFGDLGSQELTAFFCQHLTPELVWRPEVMSHPNGASHLTSVTLPDPGRACWERFASMVGAEASADFTLGRVRVRKGGKALTFSADEDLQAEVGPVVVALERRHR